MPRCRLAVCYVFIGPYLTSPSALQDLLRVSCIEWLERDQPALHQLAAARIVAQLARYGTAYFPEKLRRQLMAAHVWVRPLSAWKQAAAEDERGSERVLHDFFGTPATWLILKLRPSIVVLRFDKENECRKKSIACSAAAGIGGSIGARIREGCLFTSCRTQGVGRPSTYCRMASHLVCMGQSGEPLATTELVPIAHCTGQHEMAGAGLAFKTKVLWDRAQMTQSYF